MKNKEISALSGRIKYLLSLAILIFVVHHIVLLGVIGFAGRSATFWISYVFQLLTFVAVGVSIALLENRKLRLHDWLFRLPLIRHSAIYAACEWVVSLVFMFFSERLSWSIAIAMQSILLGVYLAFALSCFVAVETVAEVCESINAQRLDMKLLKLDAENVARTAKDSAVKKDFEELAQQIRFSDPTSCAETAKIEEQLSVCIKAALEAARNEDAEQCRTLCEQAVSLLEERNERRRIFRQCYERI